MTPMFMRLPSTYPVCGLCVKDASIAAWSSLRIGRLIAVRCILYRFLSPLTRMSMYRTTLHMCRSVCINASVIPHSAKDAGKAVEDERPPDTVSMLDYSDLFTLFFLLE